MRHKIKGIVIKEAPKGETSKLLTVLTGNLGVITINAKGVRKISSPYLKSAQIFAFSDMLIHEKNGFYTLVEAAHITDFYSLSGDIKKYSLACYFCEAASSFAVAGEDSSVILRLLLNSLYALENDIASFRIIKSAFELRLCSECGLKPEIDVCADCGNSLQNQHFLINIEEGISFCRECTTSNDKNILLPPSVGKAIAHITEGELSHIVSFRVGEAEQDLLACCAEKFLLYHAERGFKTLSFYKHCEELS